MVKHNFKVGDTIKTVSKAITNENGDGPGVGFQPNKILTISKICTYTNEIIAFFYNHEDGIRWTENTSNFYLVNQQNTYELW